MHGFFTEVPTIVHTSEFGYLRIIYSLLLHTAVLLVRIYNVVYGYQKPFQTDYVSGLFIHVPCIKIFCRYNIFDRCYFSSFSSCMYNVLNFFFEMGILLFFQGSSSRLRTTSISCCAATSTSWRSSRFGHSHGKGGGTRALQIFGSMKTM